MEANKMQYEVVGGKFNLTTFTKDGRRVSETFARGQRFRAFPHQIPAGFSDLVRELPIEEQDAPPTPPARKERVAAAQPPFRRRG